MNFEFSPQELEFQRRVRQFIKENWDPEVMDPRREGHGQLVDSPKRREFIRKLAEKGWMGLSWPQEYGGQGLPGIYEYLLNEELAAAGAPQTGKSVGIIAKTLMRHGSEKLRDEILPKILAGEITFAVGYTEPQAGSDLAAISLKAEREGAGWLLNGQKRFTTSAHFADWYWLAARTSRGEKRHIGITLFLIPMDLPGIIVQEIETMGGERTNDVFLDDVWVADKHVVGDEGRGFYYMSEALDYERFTVFTISHHLRKFAEIVKYVRDEKRLGRPLIEHDDVRRRLAWLGTKVEIARMHCLRVVSAASSGDVPNVEAAMSKLWATQLSQELADVFLSIVGPEGVKREDADGAPLNGRFERSYRHTVVDTIGGGTSEIQRNIIAKRGLGLSE